MTDNNLGTLIVHAGWLALRAEPAQRAEMTSQALCGETLRVCARQGNWRLVRGADEYSGWVTAGGTLPIGEDAAVTWRASASLIALGVPLLDIRDRQPSTPAFLPWGARVGGLPAGRVELPDGATAGTASADGLEDVARLSERFPLHGTDVATTALQWLGTPYLWGGRTRSGADCSGLVQSVYRMHGVELPRDSEDQLACGVELGVEPGHAPSLRAGDLLFFGSASKSGRINHVGISLGGSRLLHCSESNGAAAIDDLSGEGDGEGDYAHRLRGLLVAACRPTGIG